MIRYSFPGFLLLLLFTGPAFAQSYEIPEVQVDLTITENGLVRITEHRTYTYSGKFSWADYTLPKEGFTDIRSITVSEGDSIYVNRNTEEPGTFSISENQNAIEIKWHYNASDTTKTFSLSYELSGAISTGPVWSEFFWNFLSSGREKSTDRFRATINLPESVETDSLYAWAQGQPGRFETSVSRDQIDFSGRSISRSRSAELRILFPTVLLSENNQGITDPELTLEQILAVEQANQQAMERRLERDAFYAEITPYGTLLISLLSILFFVLIYQKFGKRFSVRSHSTRDTLVIPGQQPPAIIGRLMVSQQTTSNHLVASLFDLARRGWFVITEQKSKEDGWFSSEDSTFRVDLPDRKPDDDLSNSEKMIADFVQERISGGIHAFDKLFEGGDSSVSKWYTKWVSGVKEEFKAKNWVDTSSYTGVILNLALQLLLLAGAIILAVRGTGLAVAAIAVTGLMIAGSFFIVRRTEEGENVYREWKAYFEGLKNADKRTVRMEMLDRHFIYATAFHLSKKQLQVLLETSHDSSHALIPWIIFLPGSQASSISAAATMSTLAASGSSSFTGVTGAGSGASVGVAGGGASGGAG